MRVLGVLQQQRAQEALLALVGCSEVQVHAQEQQHGVLQAEGRRLKSAAILATNLYRVRAYSQVREKQRREPEPFAE